MVARINKLLSKTVELWLVVLALTICGLAGWLASSLVLGHSIDSSRFPLLGNAATRVARAPIQFLRMFSPPAGLVSSEQRFEFKRGAEYPQETSQNIHPVIIHHDGENRGWVIEVFDLKNKQSKKISVQSAIEEATETLRPSLLNHVEKHSSVPRAARIDEAGNIFTLTNSKLIISVSPSGSLKWANSDFYFHHTFNFASDKKHIWAIGRDKYDRVSIPKEYHYEELENDVIVLLDAETGRTLETHELIQPMVDAGLSNRLFSGRIDTAVSDPFHINDVQPVYDNSEIMRQGDLFISLGHANTIVKYNTNFRKIDWSISQGLSHQHDVDIIDGSRIVFFNNNRFFLGEDKVIENNDIIEVTLPSNSQEKLYSDKIKKYEVRTVSQGLFEIWGPYLFIEETNYGRALLWENDALIFSFYSKTDNNFPKMLGWSYVGKEEDIDFAKLRKSFN